MRVNHIMFDVLDCTKVGKRLAASKTDELMTSKEWLRWPVLRSHSFRKPNMVSIRLRFVSTAFSLAKFYRAISICRYELVLGPWTFSAGFRLLPTPAGRFGLRRIWIRTHQSV